MGMKDMKKIVLASDNAHKCEEIQAILSNFDFEIIPMRAAGFNGEDIVEDGVTFEENAMIKAKTIFETLGVAALADDSGLEVDALNGAPGVYSARYAGEPKSDAKNNEKLLEALKDVPDHARTARFVTVLTLLFEDGRSLVARGEVEGVIARVPKGTNGFGYDPLFVVPSLGKSFAELSSSEKNSMSHRANALKILCEMIGKNDENTGC